MPDEPEIIEQPEVETPEVAAPEIDYDRIISGVAQAVKPAAKEEPAPDPLAQIQDLLDVGSDNYDPERATALIKEAVKSNESSVVSQVQAMIAPLLGNQGLAKVTEGLNEEARAFAERFVQEKGIDPALLNDPTIADLVRSKAELHQVRNSKAKPIPPTEGVTSIVPNIDAETNRELSGLAGLYKSLGIEFKPTELLQKLR